MPPTDSDALLSDAADSSDNFHVVPSVTHEQGLINDTLSATGEAEAAAEEEETPKPPNPILLFLFKVIKFIMMPFCKIFFAPAAQKTFVKTTVMIVTISWIAMTSIIAYIMFYNQYVPPITHVQPVWFNYKASQGPNALVNIESLPLRHEQVYDVSVQLHVPTSDVNFAVGNFMIDLELNTQNGSVVVHSSRPAILRYQSQTQRIMRVLANAFPLLLGLTEESQVLTIQLVNNFMELKSQAVNTVSIAVSDPRVQIYDAKLLILANFKGLRYYMYFHRILTAFTFIFIFAIIEFVFATIAWKGFGENMWHRLYQFLIEAEQPLEAIDEVQSTQNSDEKSEEDIIPESMGSSSAKSDL